MNPVTAAIQKRRSVYPDAFSGEKIRKEKVVELLENANWAPTHKYTEPWRFIVFQDFGIEKFYDFVIQSTRNKHYLSDTLEGKLQKYERFKKKVSHIVVVYNQLNKESGIPELEELIATSCAIQNMYLSLQEQEIAGYLSTGMSLYSKEMHNFLQLKEHDQIMGAFILGISEQATPKPRARGAVERKIQWIK